MTEDQFIQEHKEKHEKLQEGLEPNHMRIRDGIRLDVGVGDYPRFGFEHFTWRNPPCVRELDMFIKYAEGRSCFVDVGSFHGIFSLVFGAINPSKRSHAFEPEPEAFQHLFEMTVKNVGISIRPIFGGLSDVWGEVAVKREFGHFVVCSDPEERDQTMVALTGDQYFAGFPVPEIVDTIKIDVEGHELKVLRGLSETIKQYHPLIFLELHYNKLTKAEISEIIAIVNENKYLIIDTETDEVSDIPLEHVGEKRVILK